MAGVIPGTSRPWWLVQHDGRCPRPGQLSGGGVDDLENAINKAVHEDNDISVVVRRPEDLARGRSNDDAKVVCGEREDVGVWV